ncbi:MAG: hypothetical protein GX318_07815, partial [Clostridia bacterium]|nr:hypothetical protein [Clostridia bacterium]
YPPEMEEPDEPKDIAISAKAASKSVNQEAETLKMSETHTVYLTPVVVDGHYNHVRPLWVGDYKIYYLSEKGGPGGDAFVPWETTRDGLSRRMMGSGSYSISTNHGGGAWSPKGRKIAFVTDKNGYWEIWSSDAGGNDINPSVPNHGGAVPNPGDLWAYNPVWSPSGELAFLTNRFGSTDIMTVSGNGNQRLITRNSSAKNNLVWSPNGNLIAFQGSGQKGNAVHVVEKNGKNLKAVTPVIKGAKMTPAWAPNSKKLALNVAGEKEDRGLWVTSIDGEKWTKVSDMGGGSVAKWSPDGDRIAMTTGDGMLYVCQLPESGKGEANLIPIIPKDRGGIVKEVDWSPDGKQLLLEWECADTKTSGIWRAELSKKEEDNK